MAQYLKYIIHKIWNVDFSPSCDAIGKNSSELSFLLAVSEMNTRRRKRNVPLRIPHSWYCPETRPTGKCHAVFQALPQRLSIYV
jgi:hypothetical protein